MSNDKQYQSKCCKEALTVVNGKEGTSYFICVGCGEQADVYVPPNKQNASGPDGNKQDIVRTTPPSSRAALREQIYQTFRHGTDGKPLCTVTAAETKATRILSLVDEYVEAENKKSYKLGYNAGHKAGKRNGRQNTPLNPVIRERQEEWAERYKAKLKEEEKQ